MYKLRRSRFVKFIAGLLVLILCAAMVFNVVGTLILMDENLYYATRQQLQQKVYSHIYDYTASDLMRYLNLIENVNKNDTEFQNYNDSEIQLYRSKYSQDNSNVYFEIRDESGNLLLNNENKVDGAAFTFAKTFITYYDHYGIDGWYAKGDSFTEDVTYAEQVTEPSTTFSDGRTDIAHPEDDTTSFAEEIEEEVYYEDEYYDEETTYIISEAPTQSALPHLSSDPDDYYVEDYDIINNQSGKTVRLHYYYTDGINFKILNYCKQFLQTLPYDITEFSFRQEEFYVYYSDYDDSWNEDYAEILPNYNATDSVPAFSFSTVLLTNGKEIRLNYTYRGSLVFSEFRDRLKYLSLTSGVYTDDNLTYNYTQKGNSQLYVTVNVPVYANHVKDIYYYAEIFVDAAMVYKDNIITITIIYFLTFLLAIAYIFWSAGFVPKRDEPKAGGLHAIPFDLYLILSILAGVGCFALCCTYDELFIITGITGLVFIVLFFIYTLPVRIRAKTLFENTLIAKIYRTMKHAAEVTGDVKGSRIAIALCALFFLAAMICEIFVFLVFGDGDAAAITLFVAIGELPLIILALVALTALHNGAKAISRGDLSHRIQSSLLFGPFRRHAEYLNNINEGVNKAVEERLRSESLKTELITNVSHDLKTPLTSIVNYIDLLKKTEVNDEKAKEYIEVIDRQSQRLKKLTIDIVEASKAATGNVEVNYEDTTLNVIVLQTNGEYIEKLQEKNLTLVQEIPDEDVRISTDGRLLWRVIDNLMNNICKYSMPGTRVYLTLWENNGRAFISFRNISRNKLNITPENLTERFVRGDSSRNTEGSGLGLSIANSLTEIMGGKLSIIIDGDLFKVTLSFPTLGSEE